MASNSVKYDSDTITNQKIKESGENVSSLGVVAVSEINSNQLKLRLNKRIDKFRIKLWGNVRYSNRRWYTTKTIGENITAEMKTMEREKYIVTENIDGLNM